MKLPLVNNQNYIIYLEYFNNLYWLHTDVFKWSSVIKKQFIKDLNTLQRLINDNLFSLVDNTKLGKFASIINFEFLQEITGTDNTRYHVYTRRLEWVD
jgi:hypothetical protein